VFEKTWSATQKNVKSHVFLDFEKKRKKTYVDSQATKHSAFNYSITGSQYR